MLTTFLVLVFGMVLIGGLVLITFAVPRVADIKEEDVTAGKHRIYKGMKFSPWGTVIDCIGGLLVLVGWPMIIFLSMNSESFIEIRRFMGQEEHRPNVAPAAFSEITCDFTSGSVSWKAPENALWVIVNVRNGKSTESFPFTTKTDTKMAQKSLSDKIKKASEVGFHYGSIDGPSTEVVFKK